MDVSATPAPIPAPTAICGYCNRTYPSGSRCLCQNHTRAGESRGTEISARNVAQRLGVAAWQEQPMRKWRS